MPFEPRFAVPSAFPFWLKDTGPVGVGPDPLLGPTDAVNVTGAPETAEGAELTREVVDAAVVATGVIVWVTAAEALPS